MQSIPDSILLHQLKTGDSSSFEIIYKLYFTSIAFYILNTHGSEEDAEDVFQEAIIVLLQKLREPHFVLTCSLKTYLFAIAKNIWFKRLRNNKFIFVDLEKYQHETEPFSAEPEPEVSNTEKLKSWFQNLTENCKRILKAIFFLQEPMDSLMQKMGWKNKHTAHNQKYKCIQQIKRQKEKENKAQ